MDVVLDVDIVLLISATILSSGIFTQTSTHKRQFDTKHGSLSMALPLSLRGRSQIENSSLSVELILGSTQNKYLVTLRAEVFATRNYHEIKFHD